MDLTYGRIRDLGGLPEALRSIAGDEGVAEVFDSQDLPLKLLDYPDALVPMRDLIALYHRASEVTALRSFGLEASRDLSVGDFGAFGTYVSSAKTLAEAITRLRKVTPYYETGSDITAEFADEKFIVSYRNILQNLNGWRHAGDFTLCLLACIIKCYLGEEWRPDSVENCYTKGRWIQDSEDFFDAPTHGGKDRLAIVLPRELAEARRLSEDLDNPFVSFADVVRGSGDFPQSIVDVVANMIERRLIDGRSDFEGTASALGIGPRTIQRRLSEHGLTYRRLLLKIRMRRAQGLLAEPDILVNQIGHECGYASAPQFTRAFKTEFGITPQAYRQSIY